MAALFKPPLPRSGRFQTLSSDAASRAVAGRRDWHAYISSGNGAAFLCGFRYELAEEPLGCVFLLNNYDYISRTMQASAYSGLLRDSEVDFDGFFARLMEDQRVQCVAVHRPPVACPPRLVRLEANKKIVYLVMPWAMCLGACGTVW